MPKLISSNIPFGEVKDKYGFFIPCENIKNENILGVIYEENKIGYVFYPITKNCKFVTKNTIA